MPDGYWNLARRVRAVAQAYVELSERLQDKERRALGVRYQTPVFEAVHRGDYRAAERLLAHFERAVREFRQYALPGATPGDRFNL
jgi:hypothetical protein